MIREILILNSIFFSFSVINNTIGENIYSQGSMDNNLYYVNKGLLEIYEDIGKDHVA